MPMFNAVACLTLLTFLGWASVKQGNITVAVHNKIPTHIRNITSQCVCESLLPSVRLTLLGTWLWSLTG